MYIYIYIYKQLVCRSMPKAYGIRRGGVCCVLDACMVNPVLNKPTP